MSRDTAILFSVVLLAAAVSTVAMFYFSTMAGVIQVCVLAALILAVLLFYFRKTRYYQDVIKKAGTYFDTEGKGNDFPIPMAVVGKNGDVIWYNAPFQDKLIPDNVIPFRKIGNFIGGVTSQDLLEHPEGLDIHVGDRIFTAYAGQIDEKTQSYCLFLLDNTELKRAASEYRRSKPSVLYLCVDNMDEVRRNFKSSECEVINGGVETILEQWAAKLPGLLKKISDGNYFMILEEQGLEQLISGRFDILKRIRDYKFGENPVELTISIGAGRGETLAEANDHARLALEMSESRGGDQATVNTDGNMEFFGGTVGGTTSSSKVKARIMSQNFHEQFQRHDVIFTTGHTFSDLDSIGASIGIYEMARSLGKPCYIIANRDTTMSTLLIDHFQEAVDKDAFLDADEAIGKARGRDSLLVVVDTHRPNSLEYPGLSEKFDTVCVVDHHRRTANYIKDAELFYSEPNSSSACEMVTELIEYFPEDIQPDPMTCNALLAGIMLDTRNFVLGTGVRTFEAAAYLKNHGADTVAVKQLFSNSLDNYKVKASILRSAETYHDCAIASTDQVVPNMRVIASQVADDMLSVTGVKSSYVLFESGGKINISARSLGQMNVQVIMEKLGGGGHFTMAATQIADISMEEAITLVKKSIDEYIEME